MTALNRIVHDPAIKSLYQQQIATGKTKKEAVQYIMRKTAILVYAMMKSGEKYDPEGKKKEVKA